MTVGQYAFRDIRVAPEVAANGTKVDTATRRLLGTLTAPLGSPVLHRPEEERGSLANMRRSVVVGEDLSLTYEGDALTDLIQYLLNMGIISIDTPTDEDPIFKWEFRYALSTPNTPKSMTFQFGDNLAQYDIEYCIARQIQFSGVMNEVVKMRAEMFGRNFETTSWAPVQPATAIEPDSTEVLLANKTLLYMGDAGSHGGAGAPEITATLLGFTWTLDTGYRPVKHGSATNYFDAIVQSPPKVTCEITAEFNTSMEAERAKFVIGAQRNITLVLKGTGDDRLALMWSGVHTSWDPLSQEDGLEIVRFTNETEYDPTYANYIEAVLQNSINGNL